MLHLSASNLKKKKCQEILDLIEDNKVIVITKYGKPVATLLPFGNSEKQIFLGTGKKYLKNIDDSYDPFYGDEEIAKDFEEAIDNW